MSTEKKAVALVKAPETPQDIVKREIERFTPAWKKVLPKGARAEWFAAEATIACRKNPDLYICTPESRQEAFTMCAELGLSPAGTLGSAYVIPFNKRVKDDKSGKWNTVKVAQLVIGYRGMVDLASRGGDVLSLRANVVYEGEEFIHEDGLGPVLRHVPARMAPEQQDPERLQAVYAIAKMKNGESTFTVLYRPDVDRAKASAQGADGDKSPWRTHTAEMWKKTALRRLMKMLPLNPERVALMARAESVDADRAEDMGAVVDSTWEPATGTAALRKSLGVGAQREEVEASPVAEPLPITHPDAEPPADVVLPGQEGQ